MDFGLRHEELATIWFFLMGVILCGYALLDGFDLGVGMLHPFVARNDEERRISMNSIGPIWDGNEVWLVVFGGALFAMFPNVYAAIFSGFYTLFFCTIVALIFRAVSFDFRGKVAHPAWRRFWDASFFAGSGAAAFLFGVATGNILRGVSLTPSGEVAMSFAEQMNPYALLVGCMTVALFSMHGALYLYFKTEGELQARVQRYVWRTFGLFMAAYIMTTMFTLVAFPHVVRHFTESPWLWLVPIANVLALANVPRAVHQGRSVYAFLSSCACVVSLVLLLGTALFPYLLIDAERMDRSISIVAASSSPATLGLGLLFALIGLPFVLSYSATIYWVFRGKVKINHLSY